MDSMKFAKALNGEQELVLVAIDCDSSDGVWDLMVYAEYFSAERRHIESESFESFDSLSIYAAESYGVSAADWRDKFVGEFTHRFNYSITSLGTPELMPVSGNGRVAVEFGGGPTEKSVSLRGDPEGLTSLAQWLLCMAQTEPLDDGTHHHFQTEDGQIELTVGLTPCVDKYRPISVDMSGFPPPSATLHRLPDIDHSNETHR